MIGTKIKFKSGGAGFDFSSPVRDYDTTLQNALVNLGTDIGSDPIYPERGTALYQTAVDGGILNESYANQAGTVAAAKTVSFLSDNDMDANSFVIKSMTLKYICLAGQTLAMQITATFTDGVSRGTNTRL